MALVKQNLTVNFGGDLDLKTDPFQVDPENFAAFNNAVRTTGKRFEKRNGFQNLASFSTPYATNLAVFGGGLLGIGSSVQVYSPDTSAIYSRGGFQPVGLSVLPAIRNSATQTSADVAIAPNGLACVVAQDSQAGVIYQIIDSATGNVVTPINTVTGSTLANPKVFILGTYFLILYSASTSLEYAAIPWASPNTSPTAGALATMHTAVFDAYSYGGSLYIAWNSTDSSGASYRLAALSSALSLGSATITGSPVPSILSVTVDSVSSPINIWVCASSYNSGTTTTLVTAAAFSSSLTNTLSPTTIFTTAAFSFLVTIGLTCIVTSANPNPILNVILGQYFGVTNSTVNDWSLAQATCTLGGTVVGPTAFLYQLNVASRPVQNPVDNKIYFLALYPNTNTPVVTYQPTYFLVDTTGDVVGKLAYSNAGTPTGTVISGVNQSSNGNTITVAYLYQDLIAAVNKANGAEPGGIYNQAGVNIASFTFNESTTISSEIGGSLQMSGGFLWMFDGQKAVENNFHVWPDPIGWSAAGSGGNIDSANQPYYYQVTYEWTDAAGNLHRSAPSIPIEVLGMSGSSNTVTLNIPPLGFTAKLAPNPVRIVVYRWSTVNQVYYQVSSLDDTSGANPLTINNPGGGTQSFVDTLADASIIGNNILYTTGGVLEDIGGPATELMALFDTRLWLVDAEDPNLLWYSKQVIESTPVEMSDLLTFYVAPTTSSQTSTGPITSLASMDDKLIIFKENAIYYINGTGPDNTGANNNYSQPIFITAAVGCSNQKSIVLTPNGLMFQTSQGIWMLGRDLSTNYIGAPVEGYNSDTVTSAVSIPNTTQIRFTLNTGTELVYDYFFQKWDTGTPPTAISSVVYQGLHTFLDASGNIWQEDSGSYVDGSTPVNLSFTTPWYNLAGVQGYERAYYAYLLGQYLSPHILTVQIYYDYSSTVGQTVTLNPNLGNPAGTGPATFLEQFRIFFEQQKCQAVKFTVTESFDSTFGGTAGAGLTLSGINFVLGIKKSYKPISTAQSAG